MTLKVNKLMVLLKFRHIGSSNNREAWLNSLMKIFSSNLKDPLKKSTKIILNSTEYPIEYSIKLYVFVKRN